MTGLVRISDNTACLFRSEASVFEKVLSGEAEVLSGETLLRRMGAPIYQCALSGKTLFHLTGPLRFQKENKQK